MAAICVRLGFWQLSRLQQRRALNQAQTSALQQPEVSLNQLDGPEQWAAYRRVSATGSYLPQESVLLTARSLSDQSGYNLVTPFRLSGAETVVLVNRGWVPYSSAQDDVIGRAAVSHPLTIHGVLKPSQPQAEFLFGPQPALGDPDSPRLLWRSLDVEAVAPQLSGSPAPLYLALTEPDSTGADAPIPQPELELDAGPHLAYAVQWFAFAAIALAGGWVWVRRQREPISAGNI